MTRPHLDAGYWGPGFNLAGVIELLPFLNVTRWPGGGGYLEAGWLFWYATLEWRPR